MRIRNGLVACILVAIRDPKCLKVEIPSSAWSICPCLVPSVRKIVCFKLSGVAVVVRSHGKQVKTTLESAVRFKAALGSHVAQMRATTLVGY